MPDVPVVRYEPPDYFGYVRWHIMIGKKDHTGQEPTPALAEFQVDRKLRQLGYNPQIARYESV